MRRIGQLLMLLGLGVGAAVGVAMLLHVSVPGVSWIVALGLAKLTLASSIGLLAGGAFLQRLSARREDPTRCGRPIRADLRNRARECDDCIVGQRNRCVPTVT